MPKPPVGMYAGGAFARRARRSAAAPRLHRRAARLAGCGRLSAREAARRPRRSHGPAIINEMSSTTIVLPGQSATRRSPRQHHPAGGAMSTPTSTPIARPLHRRPALRRDPDGGVQQPPAGHRRGHGLDPDPLLLLHQHQGAPRLLDGAVRCGRPADRPGGPHPDPSRCDDRRGRGDPRALQPRGHEAGRRLHLQRSLPRGRQPSARHLDHHARPPRRASSASSAATSPTTPMSADARRARRRAPRARSSRKASACPSSASPATGEIDATCSS